MKTYSITEGELSHARTSIAHTRDWRNRKHSPDGTAYSRSRSTGDARGHETSHQAMGRPEPHVSFLWGKAAQTGRNDAPGDRNDLRTRGGAASALSLSGVSAAVVSSQPLVHPAQGRNHQPAFTRSSWAGGVFVAVSSGECRAEEAEWRPNQCGRDPEARQPARQAACGTKAERRQSEHAPRRPRKPHQQRRQSTRCWWDWMEAGCAAGSSEVGWKARWPWCARK
jgi:hypothetical protein